MASGAALCAGGGESAVEIMRDVGYHLVHYTELPDFSSFLLSDICLFMALYFYSVGISCRCL